MRRSSRIRVQRRLALAGLAVAAGLYVLAGTAIDARAEIDNEGLSCTGSIAGTSVLGVDSEDVSQAIEVAKDSNVVVTTTADKPIARYTVDLAFGFRGWQVASGSSSSNSWSNIVKVTDYARFGIGLYRVVAVSTGPDGESCTMAALVRVIGNPIPDTLAGDAAGALATLSALGIGGGAIKSLGGGSGLPPVDDSTGGGGGSGGGGSEPEMVPVGLLPPDDDWCFPGFVMAVLMTIGFMAVGGAGAPAAGPPAQRLPRARWRPHIAFIPILSGILGAVAVLILFQQYGIMFPSLTVTIEALVAGLVVGVGLPSLLRIIPVRRWNRRVAIIEQARAQRAAAAATTPAPPPMEPEAPAPPR
jgi:hypothetical protein